MKKIQYFSQLLLQLCLLAGSLMAQQDVPGRFTNLGPQVSAAVIQGSIFLTDSAGQDMVYTVVRGNPAHLLGYKIATNELILDELLPGTDGAWDMTVSSDGWLYIPGAQKGLLFRHFPGRQKVENLGTVLPTESLLWSLASGQDGEIFGGTYPGCRVFRYHPNEGFSDVGRGPMVEGENYVRSLAYHHKTGKIYAGIGAHAQLVELDPETGSKRFILPEEFKDEEFVYNLEIIEGLPGGDRLLALITSGNTVLVYNLETKKFEQQLNAMNMAVSQSDKDNRFYYTVKSDLYSRDLSRPELTPLKHSPDVGSAKAMYLSKDEKLYVLSSDAGLVILDLQSGHVKSSQLTIPAQPIAIQSIMKGPDGRIWSGGYLAGGHAAYDPKINMSASYPGLDQTEGMTVRDKYIYFGIYPHARMYEYDTRVPWDVKKGNPRFLGKVSGQSRSFAVLSEKESGLLFWGMVPEYGKLGGALVSYDPGKSDLKSYGPVVQDQSIISLVYTNHTLWGGTTVSGGLGIKPSTSEAKLFSWDVQKQAITDEFIPVPGAKAITSLIQDPDGQIWGMAGGTLFIFDPRSKKVVQTKVLYPTRPLTSHVWRDAFLVQHLSGMIYGTGNGLFFSIDPKTMKVEVLSRSAGLLAMDDQGRMYFVRGTDLWQYDYGK